MINDLHDENDSKPYKATKNLNTIIGNPNINIDNNLDVNIKNSSNTKSNKSVKNKNNNPNFDPLFINKPSKEKYNDLEEKYINQVFNFEDKKPKSDKEENDNKINISNLDSLDSDSENNSLNQILKKSINNDSKSKKIIDDENSNFETKEKNSEEELSSKIKIAVIVSIILALSLIILPFFNKIIFGY